MLSEQILTACEVFPVNNKERFLIYPMLAIYSPLENLVKTAVGGIFTALSLISLGLCSPINNVANWTRYSRGILAIPSQIIGNIFEVHSKILTNYNITVPAQCALANVISSAVLTKSEDNGKLLNKNKIELDRKDIDYLSDILLRKAYCLSTNLFQKRSESKIQLLAKHIVFRICLVIDALTSASLLGIIIPITSGIFIPLALYNRGREAKYNDFAFLILKLPQLIHSICLSLRMIVNPLQFTKQSSSKLIELDANPIRNALHAPGIFWRNSLEAESIG